MTHTRTALLILTPREAAVFSRSAATLGHHQTLAAPPGSVLLGWAAKSYSQYNDAFNVFHSGLVRFSDTLPLTPDGEVAYPCPSIYLRKKMNENAISDNKLVSEEIYVGPGAFGADSINEGHQPAPIRADFITENGSIVSPQVSSRMRTATEGGRAKKQSLFGYAHIDPGKDQRYIAVIEADDICEDDWNKLKDVFSDTTLQLGRSKNTFYGGAFDCEWIDNSAENFSIWPICGPTEGVVRVLALSPLALEDAWGLPANRPTAEMLGLPSGKLDARESSVIWRRFAPWNAALKCRDVERLVIEAGSVLTFTGVPTLPDGLCQTKGCFREAGLGRVAINPKILHQNTTGHPLFERHSIDDLKLQINVRTEENVKASSKLSQWAQQLAQSGQTEIRDAALGAALKEFEATWVRLRHEQRPTIGQWRTVAEAVSFATDEKSLSACVLQSASGRNGTENKRWGKPDQGWYRMILNVTDRLEKNAALKPSQRIWIIQQIAEAAISKNKLDKEAAA